MKIRKFIFALGMLFIIIGFGVVIWFFAQNQISEQKMKVHTNEFMEEIANISENEDVQIPEKVLVGNTTCVLEFPVFNNERIAVKEGTSNYILSIAAGHMTNTEQVWDDAGTSAIAAHNNTFFKNIKNFNIGDKIIVYTRYGTFEYEVYAKKTIEPTDMSILNDIDDQKTLTLITCNFSGSKRIIVLAKGGVKIAAPQDI